MNRKQLIDTLADRKELAEMTKTDIDLVMTSFVDQVTETVSKGEPVIISGFAKFIRRQTKARMGRNPATGEAIRIKASRKVRITPLKAFKDAVLGNRAPAKKKRVAKKTVKRRPAKKAVKRKTTKKAVKRRPAKKAVKRKTTKKAVKRRPAKKTTRRR
ncbi:hypothetical protein LBMAG14_10070 [Actinomycetes bacterium]|nr:hypothetical protein LBMAG14_10070 [Actinomycetes bacterium]